MYRIWVEPISDGRESVRRIETLEDGGIDYESIPDKPQVEGRKELILMRDPESGVLYWQEVDRPPTDAERVKDLEAQLELMQKALDDVILGGAQ